MNYQNQGTSSSSPAELPVKRKRGRPRKDEGLLQLDNNNLFDGGGNKRIKQTTVAAGTTNIVTSGNMVGRMVTGVIEGSFDAGYLLNVKVGDSNTPLRGVVFVPGRYVPVTAANDVAPQTQMYESNEPNPNPNPSDSGEQSKDENNKQSAESNRHNPSPASTGMFLVDDLQDKAPPVKEKVTGDGQDVSEGSNFILEGSKERFLAMPGSEINGVYGDHGKSGCFERKQMNSMAKEIMLGDDQRFHHHHMSSRGAFGSDPYTTAMSSLSAIMFQPDSGLFDPKPASDDPILRGMVEVHQQQVYASASSSAKDPIPHAQL